jgi:tetrahydrodipicolinate N-succinyltransferase
VIGPGVQLGERCTLSYNVALTHCTVGADCVFHHGVCVGQDGACDCLQRTHTQRERERNRWLRAGGMERPLAGAGTCQMSSTRASALFSTRVELDFGLSEANRHLRNAKSDSH